ncbi:M24 family metallopeptidase [Methanoplanus endosymbiosus]|uniref:Xaa-Pro peptidase family protein n=1 Tax=Methanoplanus endosymbiosus TaxID=33865 RepID=A0A9E7PPG3_9EURY|nr:Xaa-Pro peptidase family protein [Methanoplanus endosymbiosus]UUX93655.1 Xaa-Pro peptidase family protein [Methanoplanus endosymbiosus]
MDNTLKNSGASAYVIYASSESPDMRYLTGFSVSDPVVYIKKSGEEGLLILPQMEVERGRREAECPVISRGDAGFFRHLEDKTDPKDATAAMIAEIAGGDIMVPDEFPISLARKLENFCKVNLGRPAVAEMRAVKKADEIKNIRHTQRATEDAIGYAAEIIRNAASDNGELYYNDNPLTSDILRGEIHCYLMKRGFEAHETIVACGKETSMPHNTGSGILVENEPILIDLFPRDTKTGYYADMTRTFVRGEPDRELVRMYNAVKEAWNLGKKKARTGISGSELHNAVVSYFKSQGYESGNEGFTHSLGHGVGLAIHEMPPVSPTDAVLNTGNVVTIEPGLYYSDIGGVRLEDIGMVCKNSFDCFTDYPAELIL